jgi:hypothetical protein
MVHVDFDTNEMGVNELSVICWCGFVQMVADGVDDESFNLVCGHPRDRSGALSLSLDQGRGDIILIPEALLTGMTWHHSISTAVKDAAGQSGGLRSLTSAGRSAELIHGVLAVLALWLKMDAEETSVLRLDRNAEQ